MFTWSIIWNTWHSQTLHFLGRTHGELACTFPFPAHIGWPCWNTLLLPANMGHGFQAPFLSAHIRRGFRSSPPFLTHVGRSFLFFCPYEALLLILCSLLLTLAPASDTLPRFPAHIQHTCWKSLWVWFLKFLRFSTHKCRYMAQTHSPTRALMDIHNTFLAFWGL